MNINLEEFNKSLSKFNPQDNIPLRTQAMFAASLALASPESITTAFEITRRHNIESAKIYELILQSYLFLGFPRTLIAFDILDSYLKEDVSLKRELKVAGHEFKNWQSDGLKLCRKVYGSNFKKLKEKVISFSPELYSWMATANY